MRNMIVMGSASVTSAMAAFIEDSLAAIVIWLMVAFAVIIADLTSACYRAYKREDETVRISKGLRDTMAKSVVYFSFVVASVFVGNASGMPHLSRYACLVIMAGEGISVIGNMCKAHYYNLNLKAVLNAVFGKFGVPNGGDMIDKEEEG